MFSLLAKIERSIDEVDPRILWKQCTARLVCSRRLGKYSCPSDVCSTIDGHEQRVGGKELCRRPCQGVGGNLLLSLEDEVVVQFLRLDPVDIAGIKIWVGATW